MWDRDGSEQRAGGGGFAPRPGLRPKLRESVHEQLHGLRKFVRKFVKSLAAALAPTQDPDVPTQNSDVPAGSSVALPPPPFLPPSRTKWTRLVHPSVLTGHEFCAGRV